MAVRKERNASALAASIISGILLAVFLLQSLWASGSVQYAGVLKEGDVNSSCSGLSLRSYTHGISYIPARSSLDNADSSRDYVNRPERFANVQWGLIDYDQDGHREYIRFTFNIIISSRYEVMTVNILILDYNNPSTPAKVATGNFPVTPLQNAGSIGTAMPYTGFFYCMLVLYDSDGNYDDSYIVTVNYTAPYTPANFRLYAEREDFDGDNYYDDISVRAETDWGIPITGVQIYVDGYFRGNTTYGVLDVPDNQPGWHNVVGMWCGMSNSTSVYTEAPDSPNIIYSIKATVTNYNGVHNDDVKLTVVLNTGTPVPGMTVEVDGENVGTTDFQGNVYCYDLTIGWHNATAYLSQGFVVASTSFYIQESDLEDPYEESFYSITVSGANTDNGTYFNDIQALFDIDVYGSDWDVSTTCTVIMNVYTLTGMLAAQATGSYYVYGTEWDEMYLNATNLSLQVYNVEVFLYDAMGILEDHRYFPNVDLTKTPAQPNADFQITDLDSPTGINANPNDVVIAFYDAYYLLTELFIVKLYYDDFGNHIYLGTYSTEEGYIEIYDLEDGYYYFEIYDKSGLLFEQDRFRVYGEYFITEITGDQDGDGDSADLLLNVRSRNSLPVSGITFTVYDEYGQQVASDSNLQSQVTFTDFPRGKYYYMITRASGSPEPFTTILARGDFYSYGPIGSNTFSVEAIPFDSDGDMYKSDVVITTYNENGGLQPNAIIRIDGEYYGRTGPDGRLIGYGFSPGWHTVQANYLAQSASTRFFSEGNAPYIYFWYAEARQTAASPDGIPNDVLLEFDVDTDSEVDERVTVDAFAFSAETGTIAAQASITYTTTGAISDPMNLFLLNLTAGTYNIQLIAKD
ncbi:MAG: hypothetical protein QW728_07330, partial [Thermoplasmata archaeon]